MVGDKLPGNQKDQQRLQRDITKKKPPLQIKRGFLKSVKSDSCRKESTGLWGHQGPKEATEGTQGKLYFSVSLHLC